MSAFKPIKRRGKAAIAIENNTYSGDELFYPMTATNFTCERCGAHEICDCFCDSSDIENGCRVYYCGGVITRTHKKGFLPRVYRVGAPVAINRLVEGDFFLNPMTPGTSLQRADDILVDPVHTQIIRYVEMAPKGNINNMFVDVESAIVGTYISITVDCLRVNIKATALSEGDVLHGSNDWVVKVDHERSMVTVRTRLTLNQLTIRRVFAV